MHPEEIYFKSPTSIRKGGGGGGQYHVLSKNGLLHELSISPHIFSSELASHYVQYLILRAVHTQQDTSSMSTTVFSN